MSEIIRNITIGRPDRKNPQAPMPDIPITGEGNTTVSRKQAILSLIAEKGVYLLSDAGSSNGTYYKDGDTWVKADKSRVTAQTMVRFGTFEETIGALIHVYNRSHPPYREKSRVIDPRIQ